MVAVKQYPHFLFVLVPGGDSYQDNEGNWVEVPDSWTFHSICREETNGRGTTIQGADGNALVFSSLVLLPRGVERVANGTQVRVCDQKNENGPVRIDKPVQGCDIGQLHGRIWL